MAGKKTFNIPNPNTKSWEIYDDFSGGINTELSDNMVPTNQFRKFINLDLDAAGAAKKRGGLRRIPYVEKWVREFLWEQVNQGILTSQDLVELTINECVPFYDGLHWVFNYITNKGVVVVMLDQNMNPAQDLDDYKLSPVQFYKNETSETDSSKFKTKISQSDNNFVMIKSFYIQTDVNNLEKDVQQIKLYSWNPIIKLRFNDNGDPIDEENSLKPGWVEATYDTNNLKSATHYGTSEWVTISSKPLSEVGTYENTKVTINKINPSKWVNYDEDEFLEVEYQASPFARIAYRTREDGIWQYKSLVHQNGDRIVDNDIYQVVYWDKHTIRIYLKDYVKCDNSFYISGTSNDIKRCIKWFDFCVDTNSFIYYKIPDQWLNRNNITNLSYPSYVYEALKQTGTISYYKDANGARSEYLLYTDLGIPLILKYNKKRFNDGITDDTPFKNLVNEDFIYNNLISYSLYYGANGITDILSDQIFGTSCAYGYSNEFLNQNCKYGHNIILYKPTKLSKFQESYVPPFSDTMIIFNTTSTHFVTKNDKQYTNNFDSNFKKLYLGNTIYNINYFINNDIEKQIQLRTGKIDVNTFRFKTITTKNFPYFLIEQGYSEELTNEFYLHGNELFDLESISKFKDVYYKSFVASTELLATYEFNNKVYSVSSELKAYSILDLIDAIEDNITKRFKIKYLKLNDIVFNISFYYLDENNQENLLIIMNDSIENFKGNENEILATTKLNIVYEWLPEGYISRVLSFKQLPYVKPNLQDLSLLWYNLLTFSNFNKSRYPNIYDNNIHPNISSDLVSYPQAQISLTSGKQIELFGLVPVNDLKLRPGRQRFQLFYTTTLEQNELEEKYKVAITGMTIKDYNAMINSSDYSTDGGGDGKNKVSPNWTSWTDIFKWDDDAPNVEDKPKKKKAIFEWDVPNTTQPYLLLVQVAEKSADDKKKVKVATLVETRLEMEPSISYEEKPNILEVFDQFSTSTNLTQYKSSLLAYGSSNKLFFSDINVQGYFPLSSVITLKTPEAIKSCTMFQNKLVVSTDNTKWYIGGSAIGSETDPIYVNEVSSDSGILASKSDVTIGDKLYFLDVNGIKALENLYGTADKEFRYKVIDENIKSQVPKSKTSENACATMHDGKYYLCFPEERWMLIYNPKRDAWVSYESDYLNFTTMFSNNGNLYGVDRKNFNIFMFDDDVYVDNWNEIEDGYVEYTAADGTKHQIQKGIEFTCYLETKMLDQDYIPHRKKYYNALIEARVDGATSTIKPYLKVDNNIINYKFSYYQDKDKLYNYIEDKPDDILLRDDSFLENTILDKSRLGNNDNDFYMLPIRRTGNAISFGLEFTAPSGFHINSISVQYSLRTIKSNRKGIS